MARKSDDLCKKMAEKELSDSEVVKITPSDVFSSYWDSSEQVHISTLALAKMLKHGREGVPNQVTGCLLGDIPNQFTVRVLDVFPLPSKHDVLNDHFDKDYRLKMLEMLRKTGRGEMMVGFYVTRPGYDCWCPDYDSWLSLEEAYILKAYELKHPRCIAVVVDPVQTALKGKDAVSAFRLYKFHPDITKPDKELRETTSNLAHCYTPTSQALLNELDTWYYAIAVKFRKAWDNENIAKVKKCKIPKDDLKLEQFDGSSEQAIFEIRDLVLDYDKAILEENKLPHDKLGFANVGKPDIKKQLKEKVSRLWSSNVAQVFGMELNATVFDGSSGETVRCLRRKEDPPYQPTGLTHWNH